MNNILHLRDWWASKNTYPNGKTFTRGQGVLFTLALICVCAAIAWWWYALIASAVASAG